MTLRFFNTLSGKKEEFVPIEPGKVRMYNCGPTVYNRQHIGNFRSFLFADVLRRWLEYRGFDVRQVMNITDVGHLLDDADEGEDKIEAQARREKKDPKKISEEYTEAFLTDMKDLGVLEPHVRPKATDHVPQMLVMIQDLIDKGYAYQAGEDVYFDVSRFPEYGKLSKNRLEDLNAGARIEVREEKRNPADFALWKSDARHLMKWESVYGPDGFPGWHIECSAMALEHLGVEIDIHTGGEDNVFPHHECEIAQTECHTGKPFARLWMHAKFLQVDGGKMSKSLGNVYTLDDIRAKGFEIRDLRLSLIRGHYRQPLNFTWEILADARSAREKLDELVQLLRRASEGPGAAAVDGAGREQFDAARNKFEQGLDDDLNMPQALAALFELRSSVLEQSLGKHVAGEALDFVLHANGVLGILRTEVEDLDAEVEGLIQARLDARANKDFAESDRIRDELLGRGIVLQDTADGTVWRRA